MAVRIEQQAEPIPGYRLLERLGGGGFGEVWKAEAPGGFLKAIKFVYGDLQEVGEEGIRAEQELKALSRVKTVRHPYILSLERFDIIDGQLMIVMELADRNLWDRFKECRAQGLPGIPRDELLRYVEETAEALDLMNVQYQLQHLDIKPQNLFLVHNHIKVADFGLVKDLEGMAASVTGGVTPVYAAPETFDGWVSRYSDQYSLAIVYQELLTGQRPFPGGSVRQLVMQHLQGQPDLSSLPHGDRLIIERALAKNPDERHPSCRDLAEALRLATPTRGAGVVAPSSAPEVDEGGGLDGLDGEGPLTEPNRVTPDCSAGTTQWMGGREAPKTASPLAIPSSRATAERTGEGALFPALLVAVGSQGLAVLQQLRANLVERFGSLDALPHLRLLFLDTDPEVLRTATKGTPGIALTAHEILLAQLNRPSHYLRPRDGRLPIDSWLDPKMLYRIPRSQVTTGIRALGRLAFCDNYRSIARRLRQELAACLDVEALTATAGQTGLGLRTSRPRAYVLTSLAGGTGSGMLLDLAYVLRHLLREAGQEQPDVVGLLVLPPLANPRVRTVPLGNAFAALTELHHFGHPNEIFTAGYLEREKPIQDIGPAFNRSIVLRLPDEGDAAALRQVAVTAGELLYRDLCSPLGRAVDLARADFPGPPWERRGQFCQTFGLFRFCWPRRAMTEQIARRLCRQLVQRWMSKDSKPIRDEVFNLVQAQWAKLRLGPEHFYQQLQAGYERHHGQSAEATLRPLIEEVAVAEARPAGTGPAWSPSRLREALQQINELIARPTDDAGASARGPLAVAVAEAGGQLVTAWGQKLTEAVVRIIEQPGLRLAGAEEAIRQTVALVERTLEEQEALLKELADHSGAALQRLQALLENPSRGLRGGKRGPATPAEVTELLQQYAQTRFEQLLVGQMIAAYLSLRGNLSDELREINFCRVRLGELSQAFETKEEAGQREEETRPAEPAGAVKKAAEDGAGRALFPDGCKTLAEAVEHALAGVTPEELHALDGRIQGAIRSQFTALVHVCLSSTSLLKNVETVMMQEAQSFVEGRFTVTDVAEMFFCQYPEDEQAIDEIAAAFDEAAPEPVTGGKNAPSARFCLLAVPATPAGERFRALAREALPDVELIDVVSPDDIVFYREWTHLALTDLEQFGPAGREAYLQMTSVEHFTPHSRMDVARWHTPIGNLMPSASPRATGVDQPNAP
jgi:hypothetical protein